MRCGLEQLQTCNKNKLVLETINCEENCIAQKMRGMYKLCIFFISIKLFFWSAVQAVEEKLKTLDAEKKAIQRELNEHADTTQVSKEKIRQSDAELQRLLQDLKEVSIIGVFSIVFLIIGHILRKVRCAV